MFIDRGIPFSRMHRDLHVRRVDENWVLTTGHGLCVLHWGPYSDHV